MIILRQKQFAFGGFDWAFDSNGKLRTDLTEEDRRKFEAMKKKYSKEWSDFVANGNKDKKSRPNYNYSRSSNSNPNSGSSNSSNGSSSSNSNSNSYWDDWFKKWKEDWDKQDKKWKEQQERWKKEDEEFEREWQERQERFERDSKNRKRDLDQGDKAYNISLGANIANVGKLATKGIIHSKRRSDINSRVGRSTKMKDSDRKRIEEYKTMGKKEKELLRDITKDDKEKSKKAERKYKARRIAKGAIDKALTGAQIGSGIGNLSGDIETTQRWIKEDYGTSKHLEKTKKGLGIGAGIGAVAGAGYNAWKANRTVKNIKNSKDKQREADRIKVGSGKMTEEEFVKKHGGRGERR